jgi:hypothetical protein
MTMAMAATTWIEPTAGTGASTTTQVLNVTETNTDEITNVTYSYSTGDFSSWTYITNVENASFQDTDFNATWDTTGITDQDIQLNATSYTGAEGTTFAESVAIQLDIDNSVPTSTWGSASPTDGSDSENSSITLQTASDASLVNCTFTYKTPIANTRSTNVNVASSLCTTQINNIPDGSYTFDFTSTDGLNFSYAANRTVNINGEVTGPTTIVTEQQKQKQKQSGTLIVGILALLAIYLYKRK